MNNLKFALRALLKTPFITGIAVLSLALGIGANAAIFSLFDQLLVRPLPVNDPARLVNLAAPGPKPGSQSCNDAGNCSVVFSYPMFRDLQKAQSPFSGMAAHRTFGANLATGDQTLSGQGVLVSGSYFSVLGLRPALGRLIGPSDDDAIGAHPVAVLSHRFWQMHLGSDPDVIGESIVVNGTSMSIIGVAPQGFDGTTLGARPDVFVPITMRAAVSPGFKDFENRRAYWAYVFARLRPGVTVKQAAADINVTYSAIINDVEAPLQTGMSEQTMKRFRAKKIGVQDGRRGQSSIHRQARTPLTLLFAIVAVVLLIACANIANLLLARGASRSQEMAIRGSLGAGRGQLLARLLTESFMLALLGGVASLLVARGTLVFIASLMPPDATATLDMTLSVPVLLFSAALVIGTGILFGLYPALYSTRQDLASVLKASAGQPSGARSAARFRTALVTAQIALSMVLLVAAGLFIKSLVNVSRVDLGMRVEHLVTFAISPQNNGYEPAQSRALFQRVEDQLAALPGVSSEAAAMVPVLSGSSWGTDVHVQGFQSGPDVDDNARYNLVGPGYFSTLGMSLLAGREFTDSDAGDSMNVAVVNQAFARKFHLDEHDTVGKWMSLGGDTLNIQIVGLVRDAKYSEVKNEVPATFFLPYRESRQLGFLTFYARTAGDPAPLMRTVPGMMKRLAPDLPVEDLKTMRQQVSENVFLDRTISTLASAFAALATLLAAIGLYGVLAYAVVQRTREFGLRMALGADRARVRRMVLRQVTLMVLVGGIVGIVAAIGLGRAAQSLLYGLKGDDPWVLVIVAAALTLVAFVAGYLPALRASRIEPMQALRYE
ncbi:MAG: ABC transporter permease [Gemmatimonadota bacterium]